METQLRTIAGDVALFSRACWPRQALRGYQIEPARAIADSVIHQRGRQFVLVFSRQAGKDETLAQLIDYLITINQLRGGTCILAAPTQHQATISMSRALARLQSSPLTRSIVRSAEGAIEVKSAHARYLSAAPSASVRGYTADLLLIANEAQDIDPAIWDARFDPMAASTNATTVYVGTVWTKEGLLHRQMAALQRMQDEDNIERVFRVRWEKVAAELPAYGERVRARMQQLGASHPYIRTEYCLEELDGEGGLFGPDRLNQLQGDHQRRRRNDDGGIYCLLVDVAGSDEAGSGPEAYDSGAKRDSTALTVVEVDPSTNPPRYRIVDRRAWTNVPLAQVQPVLADLAENVWKAKAMVIDSTGIGQGLYSFLTGHFAKRARSGGFRCHVQPFVFSQASKSALGWDLIAVIDSGRLKDYQDDEDQLTRDFRKQMGAVTYEILPGPAKLLRWSVPQSLGHDDLVMSAALVSVLDEIDLRPRTARGSN